MNKALEIAHVSLSRILRDRNTEYAMECSNTIFPQFFSYNSILNFAYNIIPPTIYDPPLFCHSCMQYIYFT